MSSASPRIPRPTPKLTDGESNLYKLTLYVPIVHNLTKCRSIWPEQLIRLAKEQGTLISNNYDGPQDLLSAQYAADNIVHSSTEPDTIITQNPYTMPQPEKIEEDYTRTLYQKLSTAIYPPDLQI